MVCKTCKLRHAVAIRPSTRERLCKECFISGIEESVHKTVAEENVFKNIKTLVIGVSGGKDSTVVAHILDTLNKRYNYNLELKLLCVDEGISGYRDRSIEVVKQNERDLSLPLSIISYKDRFGHTMDEIVGKIGKKRNCTYCGVFRRGALEDEAKKIGGEMIATGHNADDTAETVLMNYLRGDIKRLQKCTEVVSQDKIEGVLPRCKPLMRIYEKEIVLYAFYKKLPYFSTECKYSPGAFRGIARVYIKALEKQNPQTISLIIKSGDTVRKRSESISISICTICSRHCSGATGVCKACILLKTLS